MPFDLDLTLSTISKLFSLTKLFEEDVLKSFMRHKFFPGIEDGEDVVGILGANTSGL